MNDKYEITSCECAILGRMAPCSWCTSDLRVESDFQGREHTPMEAEFIERILEERNEKEIAQRIARESKKELEAIRKKLINMSSKIPSDDKQYLEID